MKYNALILRVVFYLLMMLSAGAAPTAMREWTSLSGSKIQAQAIAVEGDAVQLQTKEKRILKISIAKLTNGDQAVLRKHFNYVASDEIPPAPVFEKDTSITFQKGKSLGPFEAGVGSSYYMYIPKSLQKGRKHPLMMVLSPGHGAPVTLGCYQRGAERNGWILITSVESANSVQDHIAIPSIIKAIEHAKRILPIDAERIFLGGYSGGSYRSFIMAKEINAAGVLGCGMGAFRCEVGLKRDMPIYYVSGSNCWNRFDAGATINHFCPKSKDSLARFFTGGHDWANPTLMEDGMTHLHAVVLAKRRIKYKDEAYANELAILHFANQLKKKDPARALMWTTFLLDRPADARLLKAIKKLHVELSKDPKSVQWVEGLHDIHQLAVDKLGRKLWTDCHKDIRKLSFKYADSSWKETLDRMLLPIAPRNL